MTYGWDDISTNCTTLSSSFYLQLISNIFFTSYLIFLFFFLLIDFIFLLQITNVRKLSALSITIQLILVSVLIAVISAILEIEDSLKPSRYTLLFTYKVSATWQIQSALGFVASVGSMTACLNLSISWTEVAMKTKKLIKNSQQQRLNKYSIILRTSQCLFFVAGAIVLLVLQFDYLLIVAILIILTVIASFTYGSKMLIELLEESTGTETSLSYLAKSIKTTSRGLVISLIGFIIVAIINTLYRIFYAHISRIDHAESVANRPMVYLTYIQRVFGYSVYTVIVMYLHDAVKRNVKQSKAKGSRGKQDTAGKMISHPSTFSKVKEASESGNDAAGASLKGNNGSLVIISVVAIPKSCPLEDSTQY